jgi:two-component system, NtrC family, response regulator AtoC
MTNNTPSILIVDDKMDNLIALSKTLSEINCTIVKASSGLEALEATKATEFALILSDINMPEMDGYTLLKQLRNEEKTHTPVIFLTAAYTTDEDRLKGYDVGAVDFIIKPLDEFILTQKVTIFLELYKQGKQLETEITTRKKLQHILSINSDYPDIIGQSLEMKQCFCLINKVATTDATVLIQGETGTGKELIAKAIHKKSHRSKGPFISFNCAAIPESLIESELFGYEKGSFTGAETAKPGRFELANGGTLFLDEIGELSIELQVKLLRVLQEKQLDRIGSLEPIALDVRFVAATNQLLEQHVIDKQFRSDLFYRLNQFPIFVPALRERHGDIELLAQFFLEKYMKDYKKPELKFSDKTLLTLNNYDWKGNVRELENIVLRAVILCETSTITENLISINHGNNDIINTAQAKSLSENQLIKKYAQLMYRQSGYNKSKTTEALGITYKTLEKRLQK